MNSHSTVILRRNLASALSRRAIPEAAEILAQLKTQDPLSQETRTLELEYHFRAGHKAESGALRETLLNHYPASPRVQYLAGRIEYGEKHYKVALEHFEESYRLSPHAAVQRYRGKTLTQLGRFNEAEAILEPMAGANPECLADLSWLHERRGDLDRALAAAESLAAHQGRSEFARSLVQRLRAKLLNPAELLEEVENLTALGEKVPEEIIIRRSAALLRQGQGKEAREFMALHRGRLGGRAVVSLGWECYKLQAFDLSFELFLAALPDHPSDAKLLSALEKSAEMCNRLNDVFTAYKHLAPHHRPLFGRMKRLSTRLRGGPST